MASSLGKDEIRVNGISAGPIKTLAASGVKNFRKMLTSYAKRAPLGRTVTTDEEINSKVDDYRSYFIQYITQKNSSLVDQKIREGLRVDLKNLQPQA